MTNHDKFEEAMDMWVNDRSHCLTLDQLRLLLSVVRIRRREKENEFRRLDKSIASLERFEKDIRWWINLKKGGPKTTGVQSVQQNSPVPSWKRFKHDGSQCRN